MESLPQTVTFEDDTLVINLPVGGYNNNCKYCIVIAQAIPEETTINAPVVFTIGDGTTTFPFLNKDCTPILASQIRTRKLYPAKVATNVATGVFKYVGNCCLPCPASEIIESLPTT